MTRSLGPLEPPYADNVQKILDHYPQVDGTLLSLFRTFANSERFLQKAVPNLLDKGSPLTLQDREIAILRTTANKNCEYEWGVHAALFQSAANLSDEQIAATRQGRGDAKCWVGSQALLVRVVDELCGAGTLQDDTLIDFERNWTLEEQLEILALCGVYQTVSFVANVARLSQEPFARSFPPAVSVESVGSEKRSGATGGPN